MTFETKKGNRGSVLNSTDISKSPAEYLGRSAVWLRKKHFQSSVIPPSGGDVEFLASYSLGILPIQYIADLSFITAIIDFSVKENKKRGTYTFDKEGRVNYSDFFYICKETALILMEIMYLVLWNKMNLLFHPKLK